MSTVFTLDGRVTVNAREAVNQLNQLDNATEKSSGVLKKLGNIGKTVGKAVVAGTTAMAMGVGVMLKNSVEQYAQYEQLVGGVETLFKDSSDKVMEYANNAYATAGLSANEYMDTVTSFSASLLQSLGGDTEKSADVANQAVTDMSDNANKLGTSMEMIQNAYAGFAKQNYTMLDNLKLGFGGTKEEMQRLLTEAEKISGVHYDISNFADITEAIHVIQKEMGIAGATREEAMTTIEGSFNATKSAWTNLMTGMADSSADFGQLIDNFIQSAAAFGHNILPRIEIALNGVGQLIEQLLPPIAERIPQILVDIAPSLIQAGANVLISLIQGIQTNMPTLMPTVMNIISIICNTILTMLPQILQLGLDIIIQLAIGIGQQAPTLVPKMVDCVLLLVDTLLNNIDMLVDAGIELLIGLTIGITNALPKLAEKAPEIVIKLVGAIIRNAPKLLGAGVALIEQLANGITNARNTLINKCGELINQAKNAIANKVGEFVSIGGNIVSGLWNGIRDKASWLKNKISGWVDDVVGSIKDFFGIHSPSRVMRDEVGKYLAEGLGVGFTEELPTVNTSISRQLDTTLNASTRPIEKATVDNNNNNNNAISTRRIEDLLITLINTMDKGLNIDGRQLTRSIAPYQNELANYNIGR